MTINTMTVTIRRPSGLEFRDIRGDLAVRIKTIEQMMEKARAKFVADQEKALAEHKAEMDAFKTALHGYHNMLSMEDGFANYHALPDETKIGPAPQQEVKIQMPLPRLPLPDFFMNTIKEKGPMTKEELRVAAMFAGYFSTGEGGGRATHATLANIVRSKRIRINADGKFAAHE